MVKYIRGDLFSHQRKLDETVFIAHVVNDKRVMGAGVAKEIAKRWPHVLAEYMKKKPVLGDNLICTAEPNIFVCNMYAQVGFAGSDNPRPLHYGYLASCLGQLNAFARYYHPTNTTIIGPKFGAGLARGNWEVIEELINAFLTFGITIYEL